MFRSPGTLDPSIYDWVSEGYNYTKRVEYWWKEGVKMHLYPEARMVKTYLFHQQENKWSKFIRRNVPDWEFEQICCNPCFYTSGGYHKQHLSDCKLPNSCHGCNPFYDESIAQSDDF